MGQSVVINPSGDASEDFHPSSQAILLSTEAADSGVVSKNSTCNTTYVCQFCGRVCRNAQALGGHMNVHRRERALAKQLLELRNQGDDDLKGMSAAATTTTGVVAIARAVVTAAAASGNPPAGEEDEQDHLLQEEVITHGGSSASSSSPPSPHSIAIASPLVHPWRSLQRLPSKNHKGRETIDLELRLGFTPGRFL